MSTLERLLASADLANETFTDLDAQGVDLGGKELYRCTFRRCKLQESKWRRARLEDCVVEDCDLTRFDPAQLSLVGVVFRRSKLLGVDWTDASSNPDLAFEACNLEYATFRRVNLRKTRILDCDARSATFLDCDLVEADLSGTDLGGATFEASNLTKANLATARGAFLDPARNRVKDARVSIDTAVLLASSFGMRVAGHAEPAASSRRRR